MVRETRYLLVGNLPDPITEEQIAEYFGRHGKIQSVKLVPRSAADNGRNFAVVAFMDIRCASRAHQDSNVISGLQLVTSYNESSSAVTSSTNAVASCSSCRSLDSCGNCVSVSGPGTMVAASVLRLHSRPDGAECAGSVHHTADNVRRSAASPPHRTSSHRHHQAARTGSVSPPTRSTSRGSSCSRSHSRDRRVASCRSTVASVGSPFGDSGRSGSDSACSSAADNKQPLGMLIRGFPLRSTDTSIRDGLFHEYKKYGKVTSVSVIGTGEDRHAVVSFRKHEDAMRALEASQEKRFFGSKVSVSVHEGFEVESSEFRAPEAELDEFHHKATRTLFVGNLDKTVSRETLREKFSKFGFIVEVEIKNQGPSTSYAFLQFDNIRSVVAALREMDGEYIGSNKIKLGFGKSMPSVCVWLDDISETVSESTLLQQFSRYGTVTATYIDRKTGRGLVFFDTIEQAQRAVMEMRGRTVKDRRLQVDFASRDCYTRFLENMEQSGLLRLGDRPEDRAARGYLPYTEYTSRHRRTGAYCELPRERYAEFSSTATSRAAFGGTTRASYYPMTPSTPTGTRANSIRGGFYDGYERRDGSSVPASRSSHKYFDGVDDPDLSADTYEQELKEYGYSQRLDDPLDRRRNYRSSDSVPHVSSGRYTSPSHDDAVFSERYDSKSQPEWDANIRGYKSATKSTDDLRTSRVPKGHSPTDSDTVRDKARSGLSSSRTSQSISPVRRRHSKELKVSSPSKDYVRHDDYATSRRSSKESADGLCCRSAEPTRTKSHNAEIIKSRSVNDDDLIIPSDAHDHPLRLSDARTYKTSTFEDYTVSNDSEHWRSEKESMPHVDATVRSVVNTTPSWRFETSHHRHVRTTESSGVEQPLTVDSNHIGEALRKLRSEAAVEVPSGSTTPRSKTPAGSDADESWSGERPASKGSDEVANLEKEKFHLLSMLKELEEYSSGGSEIDGLDEEGRAVLRRLRMEEVIDVDNETQGEMRPPRQASKRNSNVDIAADAAKILLSDSRTLSESADVSHKPTESRHKISVVECHSTVENHVGPTVASSVDADDDSPDVVVLSSPVAEISSEFCRRQRVPGLNGTVDRLSQRSYRTRWSGESAESGSEDGGPDVVSTPMMKLVVNTKQPELHDHLGSVVSRSHDEQNSHRSGPSRKSSSTDHQPCIIPDSPVTSRGSDIRLPMEPRTFVSATTTNNRVLLDLPLPRFAYEKRFTRHTATVLATDCTAHIPLVRDETIVSNLSDIAVKTDVAAPFSPGLLSPTLSPPIVRTESLLPNIDTVTVVEDKKEFVKPGANEPTVSILPKGLECVAERESTQKDALCEDAKNDEDKQDAQDEYIVIGSADESPVADAGTSAVDAKTDSALSSSSSSSVKDEVIKPINLLPVEMASECETVVEPTVLSGGDLKEEIIGTSDSDVSDLISPGSPPDTASLEDRIRALDEKLNLIQQTSSRPHQTSELISPAGFDYSKYIRRRRPVETIVSNVPTSESIGSCEPSDFVKSLLQRSSIFDQDSRRLEQLNSKYDVPSTVLEETRQRYLALRTTSLDLKLNVSSASSSYASDAVRMNVSTPSYSAEPLRLSTPLASRQFEVSSLTPSPSPRTSYAPWMLAGSGSALLVPAPADGTISTWNSHNWASPVVGVSQPPQTPTAQEVTAGHFTPTTPSVVGPLLAASNTGPVDPRRIQRPADLTSPCFIRRQDSQSSDACDAWSVTSRRDSDTAVPLTPVSKSKEMISPPVSILKKSTLPSTCDTSSNNSRSCEAVETPVAVLNTAIKRTADTALGKDLTNPTPPKVAAKSHRQTTLTASKAENSNLEKEVEPSVSDSRKHLSSKATDLSKKLHSNKIATSSSSKPLEKKQEYSSCSRKSLDENSKSASSKTVKPHSNSSASVSKSSTPKETKLLESTAKDTKSGVDVCKSARDGCGDTDAGKQNSKLKLGHSTKDSNTVKDKADKERITLDEKDSGNKDTGSKEKSLQSHSGKHHVSSDHRHAEKLHETKSDDVCKVRTPSQSSSASKLATKSVTKDNAKVDKASTKQKQDVDSAKKESSTTATTQSSQVNKAVDREMKDNSHIRQSSSVKTNSKPNSEKNVKSVKPSSTEHRSRHSDKPTNEHRNDVKKKQEPNRGDKSSKVPSSTEKNKSSTKKKNDVSTKSSKTIEKRPEERREVKALLQEMPELDETELLSPYQSMYDMVKRRSNKEREKEDMVKAMESRAKSLSQIAQASNRRRSKALNSCRFNGSEPSDDDASRSDRSRKRSVESPRTTSSKTSSRAVMSDSDSDSSSSSSDEPHTGAVSSVKPAAISKPRVISSSSDVSSADERVKSRSLTAKVKKTPSTTTHQRQSIYTSSDDDDSEDSFLQTPQKKGKISTSASSRKKPACQVNKKSSITSTKSYAKSKVQKSDESSSDSDDRDEKDEDDNNVPVRKSSTVVRDAKKAAVNKTALDTTSDCDSTFGQSIKNEAKKVVNKDVDITDVKSSDVLAKDTSVKSHSQTSVKSDSKPSTKLNDKKVTMEKPHATNAESLRRLETSNLKNKKHIPESKHEDNNKLSDKNVKSKDSEIAVVKDVGHAKPSSCVSDKKSSEHDMKIQQELPRSTKKKTEIESSPKAKRSKLQDHKTDLHRSANSERDESCLIRPDNIFEKMEKQEVTEKAKFEAEFTSITEPVEKKEVQRADLSGQHHGSTVSTVDIVAFVPEEDDKDVLEPIVETAKLNFERLKEESSKEETIEEAVKAIMELTKEPNELVNSTSVDHDTSLNEELSENTTTADETGLSDDAGELNAAIESLTKEMEPSVDGVLNSNGHKEQEKESLVLVSAEQHENETEKPTMECPAAVTDNSVVATKTDVILAQGDDTTHGTADSVADIVQSLADPAKTDMMQRQPDIVMSPSKTDIVGRVLKKEDIISVKMETDFLPRHPQKLQNDDNVASFMTRLTKATADACDFASIAARKPLDEGHKISEVCSKNADVKSELSSRLFVGSTPAVQPVKYEMNDDTVVESVSDKNESETVNDNVVRVEQTVKATLQYKQTEPQDATVKLKPTVSAPDVTVDKPVKKMEVCDDELPVTADLYEFKDDDDDTKPPADFPLHKRPRKRQGDSDSNDAESPDVKKARGRANSMNIKSDNVAELELVRSTLEVDVAKESTTAVTVQATETVTQSSWRTNMDLIIEAVARGEFERGDEFNYYSMQNPTQNKPRRSRASTRDDKTVVSSTTLCQQQSAAVTAIVSQHGINSSVPGQRPFVASMASGKSSPKVLAVTPHMHSPQMPHHMYQPALLTTVMVTSSGNSIPLQSHIAALSPGGIVVQGPLTPEMLSHIHAAEQHRRAACQQQHQQQLPSPVNGTTQRTMEPTGGSPLIVAVPRSIQNECNSSVRGAVPSTTVPHTTHLNGPPTANHCFTPQLTVNTALPSGVVAPLGVVVSGDVTKMSPEMAKSLLQPVGPYTTHPSGPFVTQIGRSFQANFPYVLVPSCDAPRHSSPAPSDLRDVLSQPSRLAQQEQLLQKQRQQQPLPNTASRVITSIAGEPCPSPVALGQHRMPFTIPEPRSAAVARAEPKLTSQSVSSSADVSSSPAVLPCPVRPDAVPSGGSVAGQRMEPRSSAAAMLSHSLPPNPQMEYLMAHGLLMHQQQQQIEIGLQRFHAGVSRPPAEVTRNIGPSTAAFSPALPGMMGHPHIGNGGSGPLIHQPSLTDIQPNDTAAMNTLQILERFPLLWTGQLVLKNDIAAVRMHFVSGNQKLVPVSLPASSVSQDGATILPQLRIGQRMRLDQSQLEQVSKRMVNDDEYSMLLAVPCARDPVEVMTQGHNLRTGFISYLQQKQAAGIVNIQESANSQAAYVVHIFPPCHFSVQNLSRIAPEVVQNCGELGYLLIIITTC